MAKHLALGGKIFGELSALHEAGVSVHGKVLWACVCSCGTNVTVIGSNLVSGLSKSCGCVRSAKTSLLKNKGGIRKHPLYSVWVGIKKRCYQPTSISYKFYGAKGIRMCVRWHLSFWDFVNDMGPRPIDSSGCQYAIDRIDSGKDYSPENCRWLARSENCSNAANKRWERVRAEAALTSK